MAQLYVLNPLQGSLQSHQQLNFENAEMEALAADPFRSH